MKFNLDTIIRTNIKNIKPYASARDEYVSNGSEMVFLDANENPYQNGVNRYPDPQQRGLKELLAAQKKIDVDHILLGNGSDEVLDLIFRAFCEPREDNIITLPPTYGMYKVLAEINAIENKEVWLSTEFQPDIDEILNTISSTTKIIFLCSPNNPTGNSFTAEAITDLLEKFNGLLVLDEAYIDFSAQDSWITQLEKYPNLIITQTLSKAYGMAGIRLGICYASKAIITVLNNIKPPYNVNELTQQKAIERVENHSLVRKEVARIIAERENLITALKQISYVQKIYKTDANFVLVQVDNANIRYQQLLRCGVVVRNRSSQPLCEDTLRFTIGTRSENEKLISALKEIT